MEKEGDEIGIRDAIIDKGTFLKDEVKNFERSEEVFRLALTKTGNGSKKMEILFEILQMSFKNLDIEKIKQDIDSCKKALEEGGDWEKKNKLKVYEGLYLIVVRQFKKAAELLIDSIATFTCTELLSYEEFMFYAILSSLAAADRQTIRKSIVNSPDVIQVTREDLDLKLFLESFYHCNYKQFFESFIKILARIKQDFYLKEHYQFFAKEMRLVAYRQFLESYKSVTIDNMAKSFGVTAEFLDKELSHFIAIGKINSKIDKVAGVIESNR